MADDTGDGVGTAPTRLLLVHDAEDPSRNLGDQSGKVRPVASSSDGDAISEESARALIEGLQAPRFPTHVPNTATSNGEDVARFQGETLPLPRTRTLENIPATIIDITDRLSIPRLEAEAGRAQTEDIPTEPTRALGHDTIPDGPLFQSRDERRAPTVPSIRIAPESDAPVVRESPNAKKLAIGVVSAVVLFFLLALAMKTFWEARAPAVSPDHVAEGTPLLAPETKSSASVVAAIDAATKPSAAAISDLPIPAPSSAAPKPFKAVQTTPAKSPRTLTPAPANDTPVPHSARVEHEVQ